jgi:hypothetical protein
MDDLNVAANSISFIVLCCYIYYAVFNTYILESTLNSVTILNAC